MGHYYIVGIVHEKDGSGYAVYFPDFVEVCSGGSTVEEAIENATTELAQAIHNRSEDNREILAPCSMLCRRR